MECEVSSAVPGAEASWPFDDPNAEVILRSSDNLHFRVFKGNLALASPVFKDMFTLGAQNRNRVGHVLRLIYPLTSPKLDSVGDIKTLVLPSSIKPSFSLCRRMSIWLEKPCRKGCTGDVKTKDFGRPGGYVAEFEDISAGDYLRLLEYHSACATAAHEIDFQTEFEDNFQPDLRDEIEEDMPQIFCCCPKDVSDHEWFHDYMTATREALLHRPDPSTVENLNFLGQVNYPTICSRATLHLSRVSEIFAEAVKGTISNVSMAFSYGSKVILEHSLETCMQGKLDFKY
ncbi:hypothetical protein BKA82DRAFT_4517396 [Pisolithus tinctorius]|nr:hypothetical protein BKA82DRAFT_4517396 [Pisolithus tinctorius]